MSPQEEHEAKLAQIKEISRERSLALNAQAIVKILGSAEDSITAMNRFIELARRMLSKQ
jgi:hypothetical protein